MQCLTKCKEGTIVDDDDEVFETFFAQEHILTSFYVVRKRLQSQENVFDAIFQT